MARMLRTGSEVLDLARLLCNSAFGLIDRVAEPSLDEYASLVHDAKANRKVGALATNARDVLAECLSDILGQRWGYQRGDEALRSLLSNPVVQTGPHHRLVFDDDYSSTLAFSLRGRELVGDKFHVAFNCSTVTLEEQSHRGPAWLRYDGVPHKVFDIARRRLAKKSVSEYGESVGLSEGIKTWMVDNVPGEFANAGLLERRVAVSTHIDGVNEHVFERLRRGHGIATVVVKERFFASYAAELLGRPTLFRRIVDDGRLARMAEDLLSATEGALGPFVPTGTALFWASVDGRVRPLTVRDGALWSERFQIRVDLNSDALARELRSGLLVPGLFVIFLTGSLLPCIRFLGGSYQAVYHEVFREIFLKHLNGTVPEECVLIEDVVGRALVAWGHNLIHANAWHAVNESRSGALEFDFKEWRQQLTKLSDGYASFTQDARWLALVQTAEFRVSRNYLNTPGVEGAAR
ncbi:hypothetical protein [Rathayibacter toxicus]|uniref:hypothetical protein n=1 Tax=Rathayibacter toxicus TaxID=145458 RepID=UPI000CE89255|nr:hypothetical protein [Rathayibacter toxicus]PPI55352.1 hypothetical protein C5D35_06565 [Rathayibacter toxicus]QOD11316.1 hypothetical protein BSG36_05095 [Rathayibacter toxicus]QWL28058.1 hypothetical protein E2R33_05100 [Rathayibacter toxicus]QWL32257.1 hypothetical protein E2R35_04965 [Rathayibacter toxicus]QWL34350.1 hypothetical protein E2R36_04965 [Rathayibacter toxicus]